MKDVHSAIMVTTMVIAHTPNWKIIFKMWQMQYQLKE